MKNISRRNFIFHVAGFGASLFLARDAFGGYDALDSALVKQELRVKTDAEGAFIDDVVAKTRAGQIPVNILNAAYRYALKKNGARRVYYFSRCLEILTQKSGLKVEFLKF
ncbi:MAG: hypothetical protein IJ387_13980 [Thermoguttaceae bacterium]|nr:hypothetical protein [Thermoguttaceae bacterium]